MKIRRQSQGPLSKGDQIEVKRPNGAYYAATVLRPPSAMQINMVFVEYHAEDGSKCVRGYVDLTHVRPSPPLELNRCFKIGDAVDAYWENGWHQGVVRDLLKDSKYVVGFHGNEGKVEEKSEIHQCNLRLHREWDDGSWVPSMAELANSSNENDDKPRNVKLKIVFRKKQADAEFRKGDEVEITSDEEGFRGSWYNAVIVEYRGNDKYLVEYSTSRKEDGVPLRAEAKAQHIRPCPPELSPVASFCLREVVDARYNDGWWIGVISRVLDGSKYAVYFSLPDEELEFDHLKLRIHQDWKNGKWIIASEENSRPLVMNSNRLLHKMDVNEKRFRVKFPKGTRVEVKSDEPGYEGSWYSAIIVDSLGNDKYLVEYLTLKTEDLGAFLREEAYASYIRPRPQHARCTRRYKLFENVDAWYNDGWWIGQVIKVLTTWKYAVYFQTTNEVMEFKHNDLRLHQEWINGKWIIPSKVRKSRIYKKKTCL
uniref:Agenet domain-containing protein n=1 Tax=Gossypium raimondii TaxID=29730 RepID=A0A0D2M643_GOSRA|nr:hypothetical protein B456_002G031600 [Gossypium raimondii]